MADPFDIPPIVPLPEGGIRRSARTPEELRKERVPVKGPGERRQPRRERETTPSPSEDETPSDPETGGCIDIVV